MRTVILAAVIAATACLAACSGGPTLSDTEELWCLDNQHYVHAAQEQLDLKSDTRIWLESRGVTYDAKGNALPSEQLDKADEEAEHYAFNADPDIFWEWADTMFSDWLDHPDGIRSCKAAYESR